MKKKVTFVVSTILLLPLLAFATGAPSSVFRDTSGYIRPLSTTDYIKSLYFHATSTTATSTFEGNLSITDLGHTNKVVSKTARIGDVFQKVSPGYIYPHVVVKANGKLFAATANPGQGKVFIFNDPDGTLSNVATTTFYSNGAAGSGFYATTTGLMYFSNYNSGLARGTISTMNPVTNAQALLYDGIALSLGSSPGITSDGTYIYGVTYDATTVKFFKILMSDGSLVASRTWTSATFGHSAHISDDGTKFYATSYNGRIAKVNTSDLSYTDVATGYTGITDDTELNGAYYYAATEVSPYVIIKLTTASMAYATTSAQQSYGLFGDGVDLYNMGAAGVISKYPLYDLTNEYRYSFNGLSPPPAINELVKTDGGRYVFSDYTTGDFYWFGLSDASLSLGSVSDDSTLNSDSIFSKRVNSGSIFSDILKIGTNHTTSRGIFDINTATSTTINVDTPTGDPNISFNYGSGAYIDNGDYFEYHVYSYKNTENGPIYSASPFVISGTDTGTFSQNYSLILNWDAVANADGYRIFVVNDNQYGAYADFGFDTTHVSADIGVSAVGVDDVSGNSYDPGKTVVTPSSYTLSSGADMYVSAVNGDFIISSSSIKISNGNLIVNNGYASSSLIYAGNLTSGRIALSGTDGLITDDANLGWNGIYITTGSVGRIKASAATNYFGSSNTTTGATSILAFGTFNNVGWNSGTSANSAAFGNSNTVNTTSGGGGYAFGYNNAIWASNAYALGIGLVNLTANSIQIGQSNTTKSTILSTGEVIVPFITASSSPTTATSTFKGNLYLVGGLRDGANATGTIGQILQTTGTSTRWVATSSLGITSGSSGTTTLLAGNGFLYTATSTDGIKAAYFTATSSTATTTLMNTSTTNLNTTYDANNYLSQNVTYSVPSPAYSKPGGISYRVGLITLSTTFSNNGASLNNLIDGGLNDSFYWSNDATPSGKYIRFDFGNYPKVITEAKYYQDSGYSQSNVKWQGSNDASTWTDIGSSFRLGGAVAQTQTSLSANTTAYRYYQLISTDNTFAMTSNPYVREFEFKLDEGSTLVPQFQSIVASTTGNFALNLSGGNIGVGNPAPRNKLDVTGTFGVTGTSTFTGNTNFYGNLLIGARQLSDNTTYSLLTSDSNFGIVRSGSNFATFVFSGSLGGVFQNAIGSFLIDNQANSNIQFRINGTYVATMNTLFNTGFGTTTPGAKLTVENGDVYVSSSTRGIILKDTVSGCYRYQSTSGALVGTSVTCP